MRPGTFSMSNSEQIEYWNSKVGDTWARMQARLDRAFTPVTAALLTIAAPQPGEDVLDVGCGTGETTLALVGAVGDDGAVMGVDISEALLARARERADELVCDVEFHNVDAATFDTEPGFDLVVSRFGVMFFDDPVAAFANHRAWQSRVGGAAPIRCREKKRQTLRYGLSRARRPEIA